MQEMVARGKKKIIFIANLNMRLYTLFTTLIICLLFSGCSKTDGELNITTLEKNVTLVGQDQVDAFVAANKNTENLVIKGNLTIRDDSTNIGVQSLSGLNNLVGVTGEFFLNTYYLKSTDGLENLQYVGKKLDIWNTRTPLLFKSLTNVPYLNLTQCDTKDLQGFKALVTIDSLCLNMNKELKTLNGLPAKSSYKYIELRSNDILEDISILSTLTRVDNKLILDYNPLIDYVPLANLKQAYSIHIILLTTEKDISFDNLTQLTELSVSATRDFKKVKFDKLPTIKKIRFNSVDQDHFSFESLKVVTGEVDMYSCEGTNMSFLKNVTSIGNLDIVQRKSLSSNGLENLERIEKDFDVELFDKGFSFAGLTNLKSIGNRITLGGFFYDKCVLKPLFIEKDNEKKLSVSYYDEKLTDNFIKELQYCR